MKKEEEKKKIIVSACLLGDNCKYDGTNNYNERLANFLADKIVFKVCPEQLGGLSTPRVPSEIRNGSVFNKDGDDVSYYFTKGALETLKIAQQNEISMAILKSNSPSCGNSEVYDGTFSGNLVPGEGITAHLLKLNGIEVFNENDIDKLEKMF